MISSTLPFGCWDLDLATGMLTLCPRSRMMFGLSSDATDRLTESEWTSRFHPQDITKVREALTAGLVHRVPYAVRFRTIHPGGAVQAVLGVGRPLEHSGNTHFVGWNFDVETTGDTAGDWISANPEALSAEHLLSVLPASEQSQGSASTDQSPAELLERARSILRVRQACERLLGRAVIGEPAFNLLLGLYIQSEQKDVSLAKLAGAAGIPYSSAMRWIRYLVDKGLVERAESKSDRRATSIELTPSGHAVLDELFGLS